MTDLEAGFARDLFIEYAESEKNLIIFTDHSAAPPKSLAAQLLDRLNGSTENVTSSINIVVRIENSPSPLFRSPSCDVRISQERKRVPLEGDELEEFCRRKEEQQQLESQRQKVREEEALRMTAGNGMESEDNDDDDEEEDEEEAKVARKSFQDGYDMTGLQFLDKG